MRSTYAVPLTEEEFAALSAPATPRWLQLRWTRPAHFGWWWAAATVLLPIEVLLLPGVGSLSGWLAVCLLLLAATCIGVNVWLALQTRGYTTPDVWTPRGIALARGAGLVGVGLAALLLLAFLAAVLLGLLVVAAVLGGLAASG